MSHKFNMSAVPFTPSFAQPPPAPPAPPTYDNSGSYDQGYNGYQGQEYYDQGYAQGQQYYDQGYATQGQQYYDQGYANQGHSQDYTPPGYNPNGNQVAFVPSGRTNAPVVYGAASVVVYNNTQEGGAPKGYALTDEELAEYEKWVDERRAAGLPVDEDDYFDDEDDEESQDDLDDAERAWMEEQVQAVERNAADNEGGEVWIPPQPQE